DRRYAALGRLARQSGHHQGAGRRFQPCRDRRALSPGSFKFEGGERSPPFFVATAKGARRPILPIFYAVARNEFRSRTVDGAHASTNKATPMNSIIYIVGLIVIVMAILSFI